MYDNLYDLYNIQTFTHRKERESVLLYIYRTFLGRVFAMTPMFITEVTIDNVHHLKDIIIPLDEEEKKHLIFTGDNGCGKTSVLTCLASALEQLVSTGKPTDMGLQIVFNQKEDVLRNAFQQGNFIIAYYKENRKFQAIIPEHVEKVKFKDVYGLDETPREEFLKYLLDLKVSEALNLTHGNVEKASNIKTWFMHFDTILQRIFDNPSVHLLFDDDTYGFHIYEEGKELYDFNHLSSGYAAVMDIIIDLLMRMKNQLSTTLCYNYPGIVLIDEMESHLHLKFQKRIFPLLTSLFPNIQFIISTHSPVILSHSQGATIFDLERKVYVKHGLSDMPYEGIIEGYFTIENN